jgi:DNA polymerase V
MIKFIGFVDSLASENETIPMILEKISVGFPSPANDYLETPINLNHYLIKNPVATFLLRASGQSMLDANIGDQSILVVDRSIKPKHHDIVVASLDGEFLCKRLQLKPRVALLPENQNYQPIYVNSGNHLEIMGVVIACINQYI